MLTSPQGALRSRSGARALPGGQKTPLGAGVPNKGSAAVAGARGARELPGGARSAARRRSGRAPSSRRTACAGAGKARGVSAGLGGWEEVEERYSCREK